MSAKPKICPLRRDNWGVRGTMPCLKERCAWWSVDTWKDDNRKEHTSAMCAALRIAKALNHIDDWGVTVNKE